MIRICTLLTATLVLIICVIYLIFASRKSELGTSRFDSFSLANDLSNWEYKDLPIETSEELVLRTERKLGADSYAYRVYSDGERTFSVWAAFWAPGSADVFTVQDHVPDRCWPKSGWEIIEKQNEYSLNISSFQCRPVQYRKMNKEGVTIHILYWHLSNGNLVTLNPDTAYHARWLNFLFNYAMKKIRGSIFLG